MDAEPRSTGIPPIPQEALSPRRNLLVVWPDIDVLFFGRRTNPEQYRV
jgi:hypothetical protein